MLFVGGISMLLSCAWAPAGRLGGIFPVEEFEDDEEELVLESLSLEDPLLLLLLNRAPVGVWKEEDEAEVFGFEEVGVGVEG